ncbi:MAG: chromosome segregation protein SMC [Coriobacteriia bacterium]|nr:chromosome segregation protein SMC [Coriobacteriia bacterium]
MHLRSLTLKGFKSFADKSTLLLEPGVSVVVGPNGSGKSNISDAVLWVLGEQSAKALRGQAMEDVIFAGSAARQAVGVAEVDLTLDNSCGTLPLDFTEITITRRMYRSGESEYLLNHSPCRLMDIHELLHDTGLGRATHSIISQGQLDDVLNSRPEDRRALIEEAAGVLKHKKRRERAVRKLARMDGFLERARDVITEVDRQLKPLARQASRAAEHSALLEDLKRLELSLAVDDLRTFQETWEAVAKEEREADAGLDLLRYRLEEKDRELAKFQSLLEEKGLFVGDLSEQRRRLQSVLERINSGLLLLEEKGKNLIERLSDLRAKLHHSESRTQQRAAELEVLHKDRSETDAHLKAHYSSLIELRREAEASRKERLAADEALAQVTAEMRRARKQHEDRRMEHSTLEQAISSAKLEQELVEERRSGIKEQRVALATTLAARRTRLEQIEETTARLRRDRALADGDVDKRVRVLESRRRDLSELRDRLTSLRAETRGLEEVDRAFASASPALAWVISKERELPGFIGPLAERLRVPAEYERLVEHVLGSDLFALLVADSTSVSAIAENIRGRSEGEISLIPVDRTLPAPPIPHGARRLADLIECDDVVRPAVQAVLGDVIIADDLASALKLSAPGVRVAVPTGEIVWPSGKVTAGRVVSDSAGVLERKRRMNELADETGALHSRVGESEAAVSTAEEALAVAQQDALEIGQKLAAVAGEHDSLKEEIGRLETTLATLDMDDSRIETRMAEIAERLEKQAPQRRDLEKAITSSELEIADLEEQAALARERQETKFRDETAINTRLSACQVDIATVSEREVHLKRQISGITAELTELAETIEATRTTEEALELLRERIQPVHDLYSALLERAEHWAVKLRDRARFEQADSESLRETIHAAQDAVRSVQTEIDEHNLAVSDVRVRKGQLEVQVSAAAARIVEDLGVPLERALDSDQISDRQRTEDELHRVRRKVENLGPINPIAMQEHESLKERREFLSSAIEDLIASRKALSKVIAAIDRKIRERFVETFEQVDAHFQDIFGMLFPGGHASLALTDPDDPEATGIEVIAQPVGKKLSKMSLMSGGEKSLTALALLFALYRTRPCPFYILDEVEAALDDTNLRRFIAFIDSMRGHTQFIVVTHQRRTMEMADVLYGASMHADGVTKLLSQRIDRSATPEPNDDHALV